MSLLGISLAFGALISWGLGDFLIQRESRLAGTWQSLFYITFIGAVILTPFAWSEISALGNFAILKLLTFTALITLVVAGLEFEAFRRGKMAVVEPIMAFELLLTVIFGFALGKEMLTIEQAVMVVIVFFGIFLLAYRIRGKHKLIERGALLAVVSAIVMAGVNYFTGTASQNTGAVFTIWYVHSFLAVASFVIIVFRGEFSTIVAKFKAHPWSALGMTIFDNSAWLCYATAVTMIPISIAITISESYIILAVLLGVLFNKERIRKHQWIGASIAVLGVMVLSVFS